MTVGMTRDEVLALPVSFDAATTARALGISEWKVRDLERRGELRALHLGRLLRFRQADVLELLGIPLDSSEGTPASAPVALTDQDSGGPVDEQRKHLRPV